MIIFLRRKSWILLNKDGIKLWKELISVSNVQSRIVHTIAAARTTAASIISR